MLKKELIPKLVDLKFFWWCIADGKQHNEEKKIWLEGELYIVCSA